MGVLERMQDIGMPLLIHGEVTDHDVDIFDREAVFIERTLEPLVRALPALKIVFEHITTAEAAEFVADAPANVAATFTPQRSEEHTSELQSLMRTSYAVLCLKKKKAPHVK